MSKRTRNQPPNRPAAGQRGTLAGQQPTALAGQRGTGSETSAAARTRSRDPQRSRSWLERYRGRLLGTGLAAAGLVVVAFLYLGVSSPAYACTTILQPEAPATAAPGETPRLGQVTRDLGRIHVPDGSSVTYEFCPPDSGNHYNATGVGPIPDVFYVQDQATVPEGWVHNLEHGAMAVLYRCPEGCGTDAQAALAGLQGQLPPSPVCGFPPTADVVVTRFDQMPKPYAAIVWGRVLYLDSLGVGQIKTFYLQSADKGPEPWCQQAMPGSAVSPAPVLSPDSAASPVPTTAP